MPRPIRITYTIPPGAQFGAPRGNGTRIHQGCDYHCPIGTPIYGTGGGGKVTYIGYNGDPLTGSGNNVVIRYPDGRITTDMHLRERTPLHVGAPVDVNTIVGYVGITGNAVNADPPGSHLHHQMTLNGKLINPESFYGTATASLDLTKIEQEEDDMSRIIHHPNGSMALAGSDGTFIPLTTMDEVAALIGTGAVPADYVNLADGLMWNLRTAIAARKAAQTSTDPQAVAAALAPLIVPAVITAVGGGLTQAQVEQATEAAVRAVFADAASK